MTLGVAVTEARSLDDLAAMLAVFDAVWGPDGQPHLNIARAIQHAGGYAAIATSSDGRVVGGSLGFLGRTDDGRALLHSHITGALDDVADTGVGFALKQHQRAWCLDRAIELVTWTFDPLVRRNAYFNLSKLGAVATSYHADFYGPMDDVINAGDDTDRILATWHLTAPHPPGKTDGGAVVLRVGDDGAPVAAGVGIGAPKLLVQVPDDHVGIRHRSPELGRAWRLAVRDALGAALGNGYVGTGATRDGWYVLERQSGSIGTVIG